MLLGHGDSEWPGAYAFELMRDDVLGLLDAMGLRDVTLVGHSMGGTVALLAAQQAAQSSRSPLKSLVVEDTPVPRRDDPTIGPLSRPDGQLKFDWAVAEAIVNQLHDPDPTWWDGMPKIDVPALFIGGGPDSHVDQGRLADTAAALPHATTVTIPSGHNVHGARPDEYVDAVVRFLGRGGE